MKRISLFAVVASLMSLALNGQADFRSLKGDVNLIIANDLGRNGAFQQKPVAELMGEVAGQSDVSAVMALGDTHHYIGIQSVADPLWMTNYELVYSRPELQVEWCPVLGNHEYYGNTQAVIDYSEVSRRWCMPDRYYTRVFSGNGTTVRVVFVDTAPLIDQYSCDPDNYPDACSQNIDRQLAWIDSTLTSAGEDWIIVAGHHPVYAQTDKDEAERGDMQRRLLPVRARHDVDMYVAGHIHNFQHIRRPDSKTDFVVNSSGSLSRRNVRPMEGTVFCDGSEGFSLLTADRHSLRLHMIDKDGNIIHVVERRK